MPPLYDIEAASEPPVDPAPWRWTCRNGHRQPLGVSSRCLRCSERFTSGGFPSPRANSADDSSMVVRVYPRRSRVRQLFDNPSWRRYRMWRDNRRENILDRVVWNGRTVSAASLTAKASQSTESSLVVFAEGPLTEEQEARVLQNVTNNLAQLSFDHESRRSRERQQRFLEQRHDCTQDCAYPLQCMRVRQPTARQPWTPPMSQSQLQWSIQRIEQAAARFVAATSGLATGSENEVDVVEDEDDNDVSDSSDTNDIDVNDNDANDTDANNTNDEDDEEKVTEHGKVDAQSEPE